MMIIEHQVWADGRHSLLHRAGDREFIVVYDPSSVTRETAERALMRQIEPEIPIIVPEGWDMRPGATNRV